MDKRVTSPTWDSPPQCKQALKALSILSELTGQTIPVVIRILLSIFSIIAIFNGILRPLKT